MIVLVLMTRAERDVLRELAVVVDDLTARPEDFAAHRARLVNLAARASFRRAIEALNDAVRWDRAGRVYFGLSPACATALVVALERTRPMWEDRRHGKHVAWFVRRLRAGL